MKHAIIDAVVEDAVVLFSRALVQETITCFGEDGFGLYGKNDLPVSFQVTSILVEGEDLDPADMSAIGIRVFISLSNYDEAQYGGTIATDQNAMISLRQLLKNSEIDPTSVKWADISHQHKHEIALDVDLKKLHII